MADETCARFVFDNSMVRADGSVRWKAFLDKRPPHDTSVSLHEAVGENIHWDEGVRINPSRSLLGAADLSNDAVVGTGLAVRLAPTPELPHHAEICGWPQGDDEDAKLQRIELATDLAAKSVFIQACQ